MATLTQLMVKFRVVKCPFDGDIIRVHSFDAHLKKRHHDRASKIVASERKRALNEDSALICIKGPRHSDPKIDDYVRTRNGNKHFLEKHKNCIGYIKNKTLSEDEKDFVRDFLSKGIQTQREQDEDALLDQILETKTPSPQEAIAHVDLNKSPVKASTPKKVSSTSKRKSRTTSNVDLDASSSGTLTTPPARKGTTTPVTTWREPSSPLSISQALREEQSAMPDAMEQAAHFAMEDTDVADLLSAIETTNRWFDANTMSENFGNVVSNVEIPLQLSNLDPVLNEPQLARELQQTYQNVYTQPGLDVGVQVSPQQQQHSIGLTTEAPLQHDIAVGTESFPRREMGVETETIPLHEQGMMTETTPLHDQGMMTEDTAAMEELPILSRSLDMIQELNRLKNLMLAQTLHDNISLQESRLNSRKRALQLLENEFSIGAEELEKGNQDDISERLNHILHVKNKFLTQLMRENTRMQPQIMQAALSLL